jgi:hypothetical protein
VTPIPRYTNEASWPTNQRALPVGWRRAIADAVAHRRAPLPLAPTNGNLGLPADLLITTDGNVAAAKYGVDAYDSGQSTNYATWHAVSVGVQGRNSSAE